MTWLETKISYLPQFIEEVEEWVSNGTNLGKVNLKKTYQDILTYWLYTDNVDRDPKDVQQVEVLLEKIKDR